MSFADNLRARAESERTAAQSALAGADDLSSAAAAIDATAAVLESHRQRIDELTGWLQTAEQRAAALDAELLAARAGVAASTREHARLSADLVAMTTERDALLVEIERLKAELAALGPVDPPPPVPTYALSSSTEAVDEGQSVTITLTTTNVAPGTAVGYLITGVDSADLQSGALSGRMLVGEDGTASVGLTLVADATTEGPEVLRFSMEGIPGEVLIAVRDSSITVAPPPPPVDPIPTPEGIRYRYQQPLLFQAQPEPYPSRLPGGLPYTDLQHYGPTAVFIDGMTGWAWDRKGGDWIDVTGARYGSKPWARLDISTEGEHSTDVTDLVNDPGWLAIYLRANSQRSLAGPVSANAARIEVVYEDGTPDTLACWVHAPIDGSSTYPHMRDAAVRMPAVMEFHKPKRKVALAKLFATSIGTAAAPASGAFVDLFKLDPSINRDAPTTGLAEDFPLDVGIDQHPAVFGAHRYEDGSSYEDFVSPLVVNIDDERNFDPALFGRGPVNTALLPHKDLGKWISAGPDWKLIGSDNTEDGFQPWAPGLGAMRIRMAPQIVQDRVTGIKELVHDGQTTGYDGTGAAGAKIYLPADRYGLQRRMFVRTGIRLARGQGWVEGQAGRRHVFAQGTQSKWTDDAGKCMVMPIHNTTLGGFSGSAGGDKGWQTRCSWAYNDSMLGGPDENGWTLGAHTFDFAGQQPPGHNYSSTDTRDKTQFGQRGGLGSTMYFDRWYDFEAEILLNSVGQPGVLANGEPHFKDGVRQFWTADGAWRVWIDGRLAFERTGMVMRSLPVANPGFRAGYCRPCRELGAVGIMLNWFHGGVTVNARPRTMFLSGLVWASERIGPMRR